MSSFKKPVLRQGWMRALLFLVIFVGLYLSGSWLLKQTQLSNSIDPVYAGASLFALSALILVPIFRVMIDRKPLTSLGFTWKMSTSFIRRLNVARNHEELHDREIAVDTMYSTSGAIETYRSTSPDIEPHSPASLTVKPDHAASVAGKRIGDGSPATIVNRERSLATETNDGLLGLLMATAILGLGSLTLYFNNNIGFNEGSGTLQDLLTGLILMSVIAFAEEAVFRGYILNNLLESMNPWLALIISALIFALLHSGNPEAGILAVVNVFLAGLLLGLAFVFTGNLWFAIFFHLGWNFLQGPVLGFAVSGLRVPSILDTSTAGNEITTGGKFGFEASILQTILFIMVIAVLYAFFQRRAFRETN